MPIISIRVPEALADAARFLAASGKVQDPKGGETPPTSLNDWIVTLLANDTASYRKLLPPHIRLALDCTIRSPRPGRLPPQSP